MTKQEKKRLYRLLPGVGKHYDRAGKVYRPGDLVELTDEQARNLANKIIPVGPVKEEGDRGNDKSN